MMPSGRTVALKALHRVDAAAMLKRRLKVAGLPANVCCRSLRSITATDPINQGVPLEDIRYLLGDEDSRAAGLYDRRGYDPG